MRICMYSETALPKVGGQEMVVDALARQYRNLSHEVVLLAPHPRLPLLAKDEDLPYTVVRHPRFFSTRYLVPWYRWWLLRLFRRQTFDILHCHGLYPSGYLAALCKERLQVPILLTSHGGDVHEDNVRLAKPVLLQRHIHALEHADRLIAISRFTADGFCRLCPQTSNIVTIPNGVDLARFITPLPWPENLDPRIQRGKYFLFLGRLKRRKGVDVLLEAWARVGVEGYQLVIAGGGEERASLERQCQTLQLKDQVVFLGPTDYPAKTALLQNAFATVMPSRTWESFGLVVLESYASGTPVIVSALPGLQDLVQEGETGLVVPPESPEVLAGAMGQLLAAGHRTRQMGEQARLMARKYSWEAIARQHLELYETLLHKTPMPAAG